MKKLSALENRAWNLYCDEHKEDLNAKDFWFELSQSEKQVYFNKILKISKNTNNYPNKMVD
jgi:hypothetical protein